MTLLFQSAEEAHTYFFEGNYLKASKLYRDYLGKNPKDGMAHFFLGICYEKMENNDKALYHFRIAKNLGIQAANEKIKELSKIERIEETKKLSEKQSVPKLREPSKKEQPKEEIRVVLEESKESLQKRPPRADIEITKIAEESKESLQERHPKIISEKKRLLTWIYLLPIIVLAGILLTLRIRHSSEKNKEWKNVLQLMNNNPKGFVGIRKKDMFGIFFFSNKKMLNALLEIREDVNSKYVEGEKALERFFNKKDLGKYYGSEKEDKWGDVAESFIEFYKESSQ